MTKKAKFKPVPTFASEDEEREFWHTHDTAEYFDMTQAVWTTFPNLKPTPRIISIRLPETMINQLKAQANRIDVTYQSLIKMFLSERLDKEMKKS